MDDQANFISMPRYPSGKRELRFGLAILLCSVFLWNSILYAGFSLGFSLGALAVMVCSTWYLISTGCRFDRYSGALLVFAGLIAAGFARSSDGFVKFVMLLFLLFAVNLSFCLAAGQNRRSPNGLGSVLDAPRALFTLGTGNMRASARGLNDARKNAEAAGKKSGAAVLGLLIAIPVAAVLIFLLMRADAAFEGLMDLLPDMDWAEPVWSLLLGGFAAWVLYSRGLGLRFAEKTESRGRTFRGISAVTVNTLLGAVSLIYCVYLLSQLAYLGGGFSGILPEEYTLAQYARRGFFEMAWLSAINLGLMCFAMGLVKRQKKAPVLTSSLSLFLGIVTLFLIAAASAKMLLYIGSYGLTRLRVLTEVVMVWLAVTTVLVCIWLFRPGFPYMKAVVITALALGTLVFWVDVDTQVARYNVRAYQAGKLETVDMSHLSSLGWGAVPYIEELTRNADPEIAETAKDILIYRDTHVWDFRDWNYTKAAAAEILVNYSVNGESAEILPAGGGE